MGSDSGQCFVVVNGIRWETGEINLDFVSFCFCSLYTHISSKKKCLRKFIAEFIIFLLVFCSISLKILFVVFASNTLKVPNGVNLSASITTICHHYWKVWLIIPTECCFRNRKKKEKTIRKYEINHPTSVSKILLTYPLNLSLI